MKLRNAPMANAAIAIFKKLDNVTFDLAVELQQLGIGCRAEAMPFAAMAAEQVYSGASLKKSQRGYVIDADGEKYGFDRSTVAGNNAYMAVYRWLDAIYAVPKANAKHDESKQAKFDAAKLAKQLKSKYSKAQLAKLIAELA